MKSQASSEIERVKLAYEKRKETIKADYYALSHPANRFMFFQREKKILELLNTYEFNPLEDKRILDLGCGVGGKCGNAEELPYMDG